MEEKKKHPSLPANYVTLAQLQQSWLQQQKQQQQQPPPHEQQHEDKIGLEQLQGESHQRHATASRSFAGKQNPNNRNQQKNRDDSEGIDRDGDVNLEGEGSMQRKEKVKSKSKQARVDEKGTKFEENEEKEKEEVKQGSRTEYFYQQHRHGAAVRVFARKQSHFNRANRWKVRGDSGTNAEKQRNEADTGIRGADVKSKGNDEPKKNEEAKPKPNVYESGIKTEEKKEKEKQDEEVKQEQRRGTASRSFAGKHGRNGRLNRGKIRADFGTNAEKQCHDVGIGDGESKINATKPKSLIVERKTEMGGENGKKQREEVSNVEEEKAKIMESQSNEDKSAGGGGVPREEVEQRFRGLGFRRMGDGLNYAQPSSYGGSIYGYSNRKGYRSGYGNDYGYGNRDFVRGKRGEKMVWIRKVDNIGETEN